VRDAEHTRARTHAAQVHTLKVDTTNAQVLMQGEFEGEDLPLYDIELKFKGGLVNALLHPNQPPTHKLEKGQVSAPVGTGSGAGDVQHARSAVAVVC
jgi:hypothetical protein